LLKTLTNPKISKPGRVKIIAEEMAATANTELVKFVPEATLRDMSGQIFFIIYKNLTPGHYVPVYKSETKASSGGKIIWNMV
jgi:hypothetical protein